MCSASWRRCMRRCGGGGCTRSGGASGAAREAGWGRGGVGGGDGAPGWAARAGAPAPARVTGGRSLHGGRVPVSKAGTPALTYQRLAGVEKGFFHGEGIAAASARLVATQARIGITADWGGGLVASADGMRFVVPVRS